MKHEDAVDRMLEIALKKSVDSEEKYQEILRMCLENDPEMKQKLSDQIEEGIQKGHSVDQQIQIILNIFKNPNK